MMLLNPFRFGVSWQVVWGPRTFAANSTGWIGYTLRQRLFAASLGNVAATKIRLVIKASPTSQLQIAAMYIGPKGTGTHDFASAPTQVTFSGGSSSITVAANGTINSDEITFAYDGTSDLVISIYSSATAGFYGSTSNTNSTISYKNANDPTTLVASGYTSAGGGGTNDVIQQMEAFG